jgi:hypothetical protein
MEQNYHWALHYVPYKQEQKDPEMGHTGASLSDFPYLQPMAPSCTQQHCQYPTLHKPTVKL